MSLHELKNKSFSVVVSSNGGVILRFNTTINGYEQPILREADVSDSSIMAVNSSCFPLVPLCNRVNDNAFTFNGKIYTLKANTSWDKHYLHGDGWLAQWQVTEVTDTSLIMMFEHHDNVYQYQAQQSFELNASGLDISLNVVNKSKQPLPFGLGWHPYFPLTNKTKLKAKAKGYWQEKEDWLAGKYMSDLPDNLNFNKYNSLPRSWVNNGFAGWDGQAFIKQENIFIKMTSQPACPTYFVFVSDAKFDKQYQHDYFCFEPMSHAPNGHNQNDLGGLKVLGYDESFKQTISLSICNKEP